jgi:hypothetical protein
VPPRASDDPEEEQIFRDLWEDETQREMVIESLKADCEVRRGRPQGLGDTTGAVTSVRRGVLRRS